MSGIKKQNCFKFLKQGLSRFFVFLMTQHSFTSKTWIMQNPKFQLSKDSAGEFRFILKSKNGETILRSSEGYASKQGCLNGIASVKINAPLDFRYDRRINSSNAYYFVLKAANGEVLGISESYQTSAGRDNGIDAVKRDAPNAPTEDLTV